MKTLLARSDTRIAELNGHLHSAHSLNSDGHYERSLSERVLVTEACFLKLFIALEEFLEKSFFHYLTGRMSTARWRPSKYAKPLNVEHAQRMLAGRQSYIDWSTPDVVIGHAENYFLDGEPFKTPINSALQHWQRMKSVRNSTAHMSETTQVKLENVYMHWTGNVKQGVSVYEVLMSQKLGGGNTFYRESEQYVVTISHEIANRA